MKEHPTPCAQVFHGVGVDICMCLLEALYIPLLMLSSLLCKDGSILVRDAFVWTKEEEIGLSGTLGRRHYNVRRNRRLHDNPLDCSERVTPPTV
jgi:hypothetical protein